MRALCLALAIAMTAPLPAQTVDPQTAVGADFARHRNPAEWSGLSVERRTATDTQATWHLWRIANINKPDGPLWVVPHDNENAAFAAGLRAVKTWGGVLIAVDSGQDDRTAAARYVIADDGRRLDPNRTFTPAWPGYVQAVLADLGTRARPIVALHTNAPGFDPTLAGCDRPPPADGSGAVSVKLCNARYSPRPAPQAAWPWDDEDSLVLTPHLASAPAGSGWCGPRLLAGNFGVTMERVDVSDGSLSNYAAQHGLAYLNFETRDRGSDAAGIAAARDRLVAMVDTAMNECLVPSALLVAAAGSGKEAR